MDPIKMLDPVSRLLCSIENEGEGDGGGEGGKPKDGEGGEGGERRPIALNNDDKKWLMNQINSTISSHLKRPIARDTITAAVRESVAEVLKDFRAGQDGGGEAGEGGEATGKRKVKDNIEEDPRYQALLKRQADMEKKFQQQDEERKAEKTRSLRAEERGQLESALRASGVPDTRLRAAVALLDGEMKVVGRDGEGRIVWKAQRDGYVDELGIADGLREFLGTDEGKTFLPPVNAQGSGDKGGRAPGKTGNSKGAKSGRMDKAEAEDVFSNWLLTHGQSGGNR